MQSPERGWLPQTAQGTRTLGTKKHRVPEVNQSVKLYIMRYARPQPLLPTPPAAEPPWPPPAPRPSPCTHACALPASRRASRRCGSTTPHGRRCRSRVMRQLQMTGDVIRQAQSRCNRAKAAAANMHTTYNPATPCFPHPHCLRVSPCPAAGPPPPPRLAQPR